jgi:hypothetical protein
MPEEDFDKPKDKEAQHDNDLNQRVRDNKEVKPRLDWKFWESHPLKIIGCSIIATVYLTSNWWALQLNLAQVRCADESKITEKQNAIAAENAKKDHHLPTRSQNGSRNAELKRVCGWLSVKAV